MSTRITVPLLVLLVAAPAVALSPCCYRRLRTWRRPRRNDRSSSR